MENIYIVICPQIHRDGFLGRGINRVVKVKSPDEVHRIQHLQRVCE